MVLHMKQHMHIGGDRIMYDYSTHEFRFNARSNTTAIMVFTYAAQTLAGHIKQNYHLFSEWFQFEYQQCYIIQLKRINNMSMIELTTSETAMHNVVIVDNEIQAHGIMTVGFFYSGISLD